MPKLAPFGTGRSRRSPEEDSKESTPQKKVAPSTKGKASRTVSTRQAAVPHMSSDDSMMERILKKKAELEAKRGKFFLPKEGLNRVRVLPPYPGQEDWYIEYPNHYDVGTGAQKRGVTCLQYWQENCPVCRAIERLKQSDNPATQNLVTSMKLTDRKMVAVGFPNAPEGIIKPWSMSDNMFLELLGIYADPDYGDFTHPKDGVDLTFTRTGTGRFNTKYGPIRPARKSTPIRIEQWKSKQINLNDFIVRMTRKEVRALLAGEE